MRTALLALIFLGVASTAAAAPRPVLEPAIARLAAETPDATVTAWVYFADRAGAERDPAALRAAGAAMTPRSRDRRFRRGTLSGVTASDLPVHEAYWRALVARGARLRGLSRWLDAASVEMPASLAVEVSNWPFVARVERVAVGRRIRPVGEPELALDASSKSVGPRLDLAPGDTAFYGAAFKQMSMMQVPALHAAGYTGAGVLVTMLDSGFRTTHQALAGMNIVMARDFVHGDWNVDDEAGQDPNGAGSHGTATLSCVGGLLPGTYASAAFGASFALGKTEDIATETPVEMDYWLFGAEWADSLGADVISSSLGYSEFDSPWPSYSYADMDGRTTVVAQAAVEAMRRGITVVNAAGNEGAVAWHFIISPGDADSIITSGAVDSFNVVTSFSSRGPTSDGRIKPDVTALGRSARTISFSSNTNYLNQSGTSFSTPLTAGVVALLLEAHPAWTPAQVRDALRETALNHLAPNNDIGWGLVQGYDASQWTPPVAAVPPAGTPVTLALAAGPNPLRAGTGTTLHFSAPAGRTVTLDLLDVAGRARARLFEGVTSGERSIRWEGRGGDGERLPAGIYWARLAERGGTSRALRMVLLP